MKTPSRIPDSPIIFICSATGKIKPHIIPEIQNYYNKLGYFVIFGKSCFRIRRLTVKDDILRANELNNALKNPLINAVIFARGGEYSERLIPYFDKKNLKKSKKIIIGFSDLTSILSFFIKNSSLKVYHGPMAVDCIASARATTNILKKILNNEKLIISLPKHCFYQRGSHEGILIGGCISIFSKLSGTKHLPSFNNKILFIEDINETVITLKNILLDLKKSGKLKSVKGLIFGEMFHCGHSSKYFWGEFLPFIHSLFQNTDIPIAYKVPSGHGRNSLYLPLGAKIKISFNKRKLMMVEV